MEVNFTRTFCSQMTSKVKKNVEQKHAKDSHSQIKIDDMDFIHAFMLRMMGKERKHNKFSCGKKFYLTSS